MRPALHPSRPALAILVACLVLAVAGAAPAAARPPAPRVVAGPAGSSSTAGWVAVRAPGLASYTPAPIDQWLIGTGSVTVQRTGPGRHTVRFSEVGFPGGIVHVAPLGSQQRYCSVVRWIKNGIDLDVDVRCFTPAGVSTDTRFMVSWFWADGLTVGTIGTLWADQPRTAAYAPNHAYSFNSGGGANSVERLAKGDYRVTFGAIDAPDGMAVVSAYGSGDRACQVRGWAAHATGERVRVRCRTPGGAPADSRFSLTWVTGDVMDHLSSGAYLRASGRVADQRVDGAASTFQHPTGEIHVLRRATGRYRVTLTVMPLGGVAFVSGLGSRALRCRVTGIRTGGTLASVSVACRNAAGAYADGPFGLSFLSQPLV